MDPDRRLELAARVQRGAALLDERRPGWADSIVLPKLKMHDCEQCVLGQVFGSYVGGVSRMRLGTDGAEMLGFNSERRSAVGFLELWWFEDNDELGVLWAAEVRARTHQPA
jgi:hypothetical protein